MRCRLCFLRPRGCASDHPHPHSLLRSGGTAGCVLHVPVSHPAVSSLQASHIGARFPTTSEPASFFSNSGPRTRTGPRASGWRERRPGDLLGLGLGPLGPQLGWTLSEMKNGEIPMSQLAAAPTSFTRTRTSPPPTPVPLTPTHSAPRTDRHAWHCSCSCSWTQHRGI